MHTKFAILVVALLSSGCGASLSNHQVNLSEKDVPAPKGIRYKGVIPYEVRIFTVEWDPDEKKDVVKEQPAKIVALPDPRQLYEVNYTGALLRSYKFSASLNDNSTLKNVSLEAQGTSQGSAAAGSISDIIKAVQGVDKEKEKLQNEADILELKVKIKQSKETLGTP